MLRVIIALPTVLFVALTFADAALAADKGKPREFPKGSERAVAAIQQEFPKADIDDAVEPKAFGGSGGKGTPLFWSVRFHIGDQKQELSVTPEGAIIRLPIPIDAKNLPKAVVDGIAKAAPEAKIKSAEKHEMRATMKYVALDKPIARQFQIDVVKEGKRSRISMNGDGSNTKAAEIKDEKKEAKDKPAAKEKEIDIPEKAARAVKSIKTLYPDAAVKEITTEVFDDGSGTIEILTYEIEFITQGAKHEMVASPEGVIPHLWANVELKDLPKVATDAVDKLVPGAKVEKARAFEIRASFRFGPLEKPKTYYVVRVVKDGKETALKFKPSGDVIKSVEFPNKK